METSITLSEIRHRIRLGVMEFDVDHMCLKCRIFMNIMHQWRW